MNKQRIVVGLFVVGLLLTSCVAPQTNTGTGATPTTAATDGGSATPTSEAATGGITATTDVTGTTDVTSTAAVTGTTGTAQEATPAIVAAVNVFLATLSDSEKEAVQFDWTDTAQKQRWSNLPEGLFERDGLMWGDMSEEQQNAWLAVMQVTLSSEGYNRVIAEWNADEVLATAQANGETGGFGGQPPSGSPPISGTGPISGSAPISGTGPISGTDGSGGPPGGGQLLFGKQYYWVALVGTPSETEPWQWQWGGHHVTVNATVVGPNISLSPSFIGCQPCVYTDTTGSTVRPLGDIEDEAFALVNSFDATQQGAAVLGDTSIDLVLGPGQDGKTIPSEGLPGAQMTADQQAAFLQLISHYTGLVNEQAAAVRLAEIQAGLAETYFAWYGPTESGSAAYFRITGPTIVIEYAPQGGGGTGLGLGGSTTANHIHGIYRDPANEYGAKYTGIETGQ